MNLPCDYTHNLYSNEITLIIKCVSLSFTYVANTCLRLLRRTYIHAVVWLVQLIKLLCIFNIHIYLFMYTAIAYLC